MAGRIARETGTTLEVQYNHERGDWPYELARWTWLPWEEAAAKCFSWSNRDAIRMLPERSAGSVRRPAGA